VLTSAGIVPARSEEIPCDRQVTTLGPQHVSDLAMLVNRLGQIRPPPGDRDVRLANEPPVTWNSPTEPCRLDELGTELLHPPVHREVIDGDAALGKRGRGARQRQLISLLPAKIGQRYTAD
jgi:hypothetical protein